MPAEPFEDEVAAAYHARTTSITKIRSCQDVQTYLDVVLLGTPGSPSARHKARENLVKAFVGTTLLVLALSSAMFSENTRVVNSLIACLPLIMYPAVERGLKDPRRSQLIFETILVASPGLAGFALYEVPDCWWRCVEALNRGFLVFASDWPQTRLVLVGLEIVVWVLAKSLGYLDAGPTRDQISPATIVVGFFFQFLYTCAAVQGLRSVKCGTYGQLTSKFETETRHPEGNQLDQETPREATVLQLEAGENALAQAPARRPTRGEIEERQAMRSALMESAAEVHVPPCIRWTLIGDAWMAPAGGLASTVVQLRTRDVDERSNTSEESYHSAASLAEHLGIVGLGAWEAARNEWQRRRWIAMQRYQEFFNWLATRWRGTSRRRPSVLLSGRSDNSRSAQADMFPTPRVDVLHFEAVMRSGHDQEGHWWGELPPTTRGLIAVYVGAIAAGPPAKRIHARDPTRDGD